MTNPPVTKEQQEIRKSQVRVTVTYWASLFLFLGGALFIAFLLIKGDKANAKDIFMAILPVSSAIISFWFAGRKST